MFIISGGKGIGKTRTLIERTRAEDGILVCADPNTMRDRAHKYGITGLNLISYGELYVHDADYRDKPIYIHDIDKFIRYKFSNVKGYSQCNE
jgi:hypothetical protein